MNGRLVEKITKGVILVAFLAGTSHLQAAAFRDDDHSQSVITLGTASNRPTRFYEGGNRFLSFGVEVQDQTRAIVFSGAQGTPPQMNVQRLTGLIGFDVFPWLTLEGGAGYTDVDLDGEGSDREKDWEWLIGGEVRLVDYRLPAEDPYYFGLKVESLYRASQSESWDTDLDWNEFYSALLFSLSTHPLIHFGDDVRIVTLYGGPAVSLIDGEWSDEWGSVDFHEDQNMGAVLGLSFMPDEYMTIKLEAQFFDEVSVGAGLSVHF